MPRSRSQTPSSDPHSPMPAFPDEVEERNIEHGCCHPTRNLFRYTALFLICMLTFGQYYCYDIPGALKSVFFQHFQGLTQLQYNLLYSLYSWPNTVLVFFGGFFIDKYLGVRWGCNSFPSTKILFSRCRSERFCCQIDDIATTSCLRLHLLQHALPRPGARQLRHQIS